MLVSMECPVVDKIGLKDSSKNPLLTLERILYNIRERG